MECLQGDLLLPFMGRRADLVICNPPYVSEEEYHQLEDSVRLFEPRRALVAPESGLYYYRCLEESLPDYLRPGAQLFFEIGSGQGGDLITLFQKPCWQRVRVEKDWAGHDRFFLLEFEPVVS